MYRLHFWQWDRMRHEGTMTPLEGTATPLEGTATPFAYCLLPTARLLQEV